MKATNIYRQDNLVVVMFNNATINISAPNRIAARAIESQLVPVMEFLDDVSIEVVVS